MEERLLKRIDEIAGEIEPEHLRNIKEEFSHINEPKNYDGFESPL